MCLCSFYSCVFVVSYSTNAAPQLPSLEHEPSAASIKEISHYISISNSNNKELYRSIKRCHFISRWHILTRIFHTYLTAAPQGMLGHSDQQMGREALIWSARSKRNARDYRRKSAEHIFRAQIRRTEGNDRD